jgi:glycine/D-amino acid oxidase-like deaminating enzyme
LSARHVAVIGGGYSGTLLAIHLLERGAEVTLIERATGSAAAWPIRPGMPITCSTCAPRE